MSSEATDLIEEEGRVVGVRASTTEGPLEVRAQLVVAADGRHSTLRRDAGLGVVQLGAPMDVLWFSLARRADDPPTPLGRFGNGDLNHLNVANTACGFVIQRHDRRSAARGLERFEAEVAKPRRYCRTAFAN